MSVPKKCRADSMAFFGLQAKPPVFDPSKRPALSLALLTSVPPFVQDFEAALAAHRAFRQQALSNAGVHEVLTRGDLYDDAPENIGLLFGLQHAPTGLTQERVRQLYGAGVRTMGIAYDGPTEYGDGFKGDGPLTKRGIDLLGWLGECGIILDLSHAGYRTTMDALTVASSVTGPEVMASHSGSYEVYPHPRNLRDDTIRQLDLLGGYIGVPTVTFLLTREGGHYLESFVRHIVHITGICGHDRGVGIGSDCNHLDMTMEEARAHFQNMTRMLKTGGSFGEYFPDRPPELIVNGSNLFDVLEETLAHFSSGILGKNFEHFLQLALRA